MSGKVVLTREQIAIFDEFQKAIQISGVSAKKLKDAILNGYEVEPEPFKEGDWVTTSDGIVGKLVKVPSTNTENDFYIDSLGYRKPERRVALSKLKHSAPSEIAEEKERRINKKLDDVLSRLTKEEIRQLINKLDYEYEVNGRIADRLDVKNK